MDCPDGEICFADTPCSTFTADGHVSKETVHNVTMDKTKTLHPLEDKNTSVLFTSWDPVLRTTHGGISAVITLWSDASLTVQGLSSTRNSSITILDKSKSSHPSRLDLFTVWTRQDILAQAEKHSQNDFQTNTSSLPHDSHSFQYEFDQVDILLESTWNSLSSYQSEDAILVVAAQYYKRCTQHSSSQSSSNTLLEDSSSIRHYVMIAMDLFSSNILWSYHVTDSPTIWKNSNYYSFSRHHNSSLHNKTSSARRRSILSHLTYQTQSKDEEDSLWSQDCPQEYESWLHSLPMSFWNRLKITIPDHHLLSSSQVVTSPTHARSMNGNVETSSLYLSFFQKKHQ
jgi:hypothetical protein